jgi:hypothetical protein
VILVLKEILEKTTCIVLGPAVQRTRARRPALSLRQPHNMI